MESISISTSWIGAIGGVLAAGVWIFSLGTRLGKVEEAVKLLTIETHRANERIDEILLHLQNGGK